MVEMELNKIIIDEKRQDQIIVLKEKKGNRFLPIIIGFLEANAIKMKVSGVVSPRPFTHDLLLDVISALNAQIQRIVIDDVQDSTFHAKIVLVPKTGRQKKVIVDARPSDSIALAVGAKAPIFVEEDVLTTAELFNQEEQE
ncbi:MAG: bifunctional nuclease family protein [Candidatus Omnitrophota bacterium]